MTSDTRIEKLESRLQEALAPMQLEIIDEVNGVLEERADEPDPAASPGLRRSR